MAAPPSDHQLQNMLQMAVQSVQWTYSLFWQLCPQQGMLVWGDGYYNGAIKTRKTVQAVEVSTEEASLQRSQQLRDLYDSLSTGDINHPTPRPSAALLPEDLTESEWFYLMCVSFSSPPGVGLPGKAYATGQHIWLTGANEVDSKVFNRSILAKSAQVQTVLCIPLLDGVVELGTTDRVEEDIELIQKVNKLFINYQQVPAAHDQTPKPALSEHSTTNPSLTNYFLTPPLICTPAPADEEQEEEEEDDRDRDEDQKADDHQLDSDQEDRNGMMMSHGGAGATAAETSELVQVDMSEGIRLGSPDSSNLLDSHFQDLLLTVSKAGGADSTTHGCPHSSINTTLRSLPTGAPPIEELPHYSQTVSSILQHRSIRRWSEPSSTSDTMYPSHSAFTICSPTATRSHHRRVDPSTEGTSQWLLKYILFTVPFLHNKSRDSSTTASAADLASRFRKATPQEELNANHVLAERRRREKLNERFIILRSLVPFVTKMDKASILGDTIEYVKQLLKKIQDLEARVGDHQWSGSTGDPHRKVKRKMRIVEEGGGGPRPVKVLELPSQTGKEVEVEVEVSIIESDGLVEMTCPCREGLLFDVMHKLREFRMEITTVQSSSNHGVFVAELRAKVKENLKGKKVSIVEVKRAIKNIIKLC